MPDKKIERKCDNCNNKCNETNLFIDNDLCVNCIRDFHTNMYPDEAPVDNFTQIEPNKKDIPSLMSQILAEIDSELKSAMENHPTWHSNHEAIGVIREEYLELETEIYETKECYQATGEMKAEAIQLAAMAIRFILDMYYKENSEQLKKDINNLIENPPDYIGEIPIIAKMKQVQKDTDKSTLVFDGLFENEKEMIDFLDKICESKNKNTYGRVDYKIILNKAIALSETYGYIKLKE